MPHTPANQGKHPQSRRQKLGLDHPLRRLVGLTCLASGAILDAAFARFQGKGTDEKNLPRNLLDNLNADDILLGDAFYPTYFLLCELQRRDVDGKLLVTTLLNPRQASKSAPGKAVPVAF
ncbi:MULTISPECIES: hypothetical protein [unclassified Marinobacter]|uniref:hypothetical protein n=1 Tax=unclassified Marinobacter TaxID=83889 RepID=UPI00200EED24|nr:MULTISPECIES: hypothetical protein [unclassified Marinobacter]UQG54456.1 hypothetical protein MIH16_13485 [Marinobacter sp. M4C]UQG63261.1 hypothetical protein MIH17_13480 [Marinobacter sp. M2C]UQG67541.1 hypothetical protein MIH19_13485 [Marinobacter sp. M1C]